MYIDRKSYSPGEQPATWRKGHSVGKYNECVRCIWQAHAKMSPREMTSCNGSDKKGEGTGVRPWRGKTHGSRAMRAEKRGQRRAERGRDRLHVETMNWGGNQFLQGVGRCREWRQVMM